MNASDIVSARNAEVAATIARVKRIHAARGATRLGLATITLEMLALAAKAHMFSAGRFPAPPQGVSGAHRTLLHADPDGGFALYLNALNPGAAAPPHLHGTWAVVVAVAGREVNRIWRRTDDGRDPGHATLAMAHEVVVEPGTGLALLPNDIHSIQITGDAPVRLLHLYGVMLERQTGRMCFDRLTGRVRPAPGVAADGGVPPPGTVAGPAHAGVVHGSAAHGTVIGAAALVPARTAIG